MGGLVDLSLIKSDSQEISALPLFISSNKKSENYSIDFSISRLLSFRKDEVFSNENPFVSVLDSNVKLDSITSRPCWIIPGE